MRATLTVLLLGLLCASCGGDPTPADGCTVDDDCPDGRCVDGRCEPRRDAGVSGMDAGGGGSVDAANNLDAGPPGCDGGMLCGSACCGVNQRCAFGGCVFDLGPCDDNDDCAGDSYCDTTSGRCTPYGTPEDVLQDPDCERSIEVGAFTPDEQCRWEGPPAGDAYEGWSAVYGTPMVADFDLDGDDTVVAPSIVVAGFQTPANGAILRVLDGRTCEEQAALTDAADRLVYASNQAIGDLDGAADGRPEIVGAALAAPSSAGGIVAFRYDAALGEFVRMWYGRRCDLDGEPRHTPNDHLNNNGPSIHDLDDDGRPEVIFDGFVYDADGCLLNPGWSYANYLRLGLFAVVADVDLDGTPELVRHDGVYAWSGSGWTREPSWAPSDPTEAERMGHVAVGDLGLFGDETADSPRAEIVVVAAPSPSSNNTATGTVRVMSLSGEIVFGPYALPAEGGAVAGRGGAPTIADFDGDGRREFAVAGGSRYTVFDLDCDVAEETADGCARVAGLPRGVLWSRPSQDRSSNVTGSSIFDFDADGVAEVVYGDECFVRIYRGTDGEVLFSTSASTGTGYELPVIADVDGDFNSEVVFALTPGVSCPATDPINTRETVAFEAGGTGIRVLRDALDRWAASRPIWNQHAYSVTNVGDDGSIPRTRDWAANHADPTLNSFRANAQGDLERRGAADLTVAVARAADLCDVLTGEVTLAADVCNRGTNPVPDGARVVFYEGDPDEGATVACETTLPRLLGPTECTEVSCAWTVPDEPGMERVARQITVVVDPDGEVFECRDGNNRGIVPDIYCEGVF